MLLARGGSGEAVLSSPSGAGVASPAFGCRIAAAYEQRCQPELFLSYFSVGCGSRRVGGTGTAPAPRAGAKPGSCLEGGVMRTRSPERPRHQGPGWGGGARGSRAGQRHRSRCGDGGGSGVWRSASWEPCRKGTFIFPSWRLGDFSSVFVVSLNQVSLFFFFFKPRYLHVLKLRRIHHHLRVSA